MRREAGAPVKSKSKISVMSEFRDMTILQAVFSQHRFRPHYHDTFLIGATESGAETFEARGGRHVSATGRLRFFNPGEVHTGEPVENTVWGYKCMYPSVELLDEIAAECKVARPWFPAMVVDDMPRANRLLRILGTAENGTNRLPTSVMLRELLAELVMTHGGNRREMAAVRRSPRAVERARAYIAAHALEDFDLTDVAKASAMSPYHLSRAFKTETGLTLFGFRKQLRIDHACDRLRRGRSVEDVASQCGFFDRSHLSHTFRAVMGVAPASYQRAFGSLSVSSP